MPSEGFLQHFHNLPAVEEEVRCRAAFGIKQYLVKSKAGEDDKAEDKKYTVGRLIRGMQSSRQCARQGFSLALAEFLSAFPDELENVLESLAQNTKLGGLRPHEQKERLLSRLFAYAAVLEAGCLHKKQDGSKKARGRDGSRVSMLGSVCRGLHEVYAARPYFRIPAARLLAKVCGGHFDPQNSTDLARQFEFLPSIRKFDWKAWMVVSTTGSDQEARHEDPGGAHCILRPGSQIRMAWEAIGMLFLTYDLVWIPVSIAFNTPEPSIITVCEIATLLYWCMDIAVHFKLAYFTPQGNLEVRPRQIALRYLRRWFFFDLLLVLVEVFFLVTGRLDVENSGDTASSLVRLLRHSRLFRMARLLRLRKFRRLIFWVQDYVTSEWWSAVLSASQNVYTLLAINHFIACIWFGIAKYENRHGRENWVFAYEFELNSFVLQYFVALHWSMCFFTPASMNVQPQSLLERIFAVLVLLFAMVVFSSFVSSITSAMTRIQNLRSHEIHQSLMLRRFLKENHVSNSLSSRVTKEIEFILERQKKKVHRTKVELLSLLSGPLNVELLRELHKPHLVDHPFFQTYEKVSEPAMTQLCFTALNVVHFLKGDAVFRVDTKAKNMYFLTDGSLYYKRMKGIQGVRRAVKINRGQWFCEMVLWMPWTHRGTMRSLFDCEIIALDSETFRRVTLSHEPSFLYSQRYAIEYYQGLKATYERRLHVWDVPDEVMYADASTNNLAKDFEFARLEIKFGRRRSGTISLGVRDMLADSSDSDGPDSSSHVCI